MATQPIPQYARKSYQDFSGGLNDFDDPLIVKQNQFTELTNALVNNTGILEKAPGYVTDGSPFPDDADSFIRMLVNYKRGTTVDKLVCAALDEGNTNATYKVDLKETSGDGSYAYIGHTTGTALFTNASTAVVGTGTAWLTHLKAGDKIKATSHSDSVYAEIATVTDDTNLVLSAVYSGATTLTVAYKARKVLNKDFIPTAIVFNNNLVITNGSDTMLSYNNTTLNNISDADAPKGKFIEPHKSRVFVASTSGGPSSIFWSAVNDETAWDATSTEIVFANDNGNICGIKSFADSLIVLKDNGNLYQVVGSFDQDAVGYVDYIRKIDTPVNIGSIAGFTAVVHDDNKLYFLAETGVYALDGRMNLEKTSWNIQNTTDDIVLRSGSVSAKSFPFDSKTQWDDGTHSGTEATSLGFLRPLQDNLTISTALTAGNCKASLAIDSTNNVHITYVDANNAKVIKYAKWAILTGVLTTETAVTETAYDIGHVDIDVATDGDVGILYSIGLTGQTYRWAERASGTGVWGSPEHVRGFSAASSVFKEDASCQIKYRSDSAPVCVLPYSNAAVDAAGCEFMSRSSGAWVATDITNSPAVHQVSLVLTSNNPKVAMVDFTNSLVRVYSSVNEGASFSLVETLAGVTACDFIQIAVSSVGDIITTYQVSGSLLKRNSTTLSGSTLDTSATSYHGWTLNATNQDNWSAYKTSTEKLMFDNSLAVTNAVTGNLNTTNYANNKGLVKNGVVFATLSYGANASELIVRRIAPRAIWISDENSDSSLTAYNTYEVTGESSNGNTITHEIALNSISPATAYTAITTGSTISTDATLVFSKVKITFVLTSFSTSEIDSVTINYTGSGIGPLLPTGVVYDNEYYLAYGTSSDAANSGALLYDKESAWATLGYPVIFFARYQGTLYGGGAATGKVFKLLTGYKAITSAYTMTAITKEDLLGSLELEKEVYKIYVIYQIKPSGTFDFSYRTSNFATSGSAEWTTTTIDQTTGGRCEIPVTTGLLKSIQFKVESDDLDAQLGIVGWVVLYGYANLR